MLNFLRRFFDVLSRLDMFFREPQIKGQNGFTVIFGSLMILAVILTALDDTLQLNIFTQSGTFLMGTFVYCIVPYLFFKSGSIRVFIIFGRKETVEVVTKRFNLKGYLVFVFFFTYFLFIPLLGVPLLLNLFDYNYLNNIMKENIAVILYLLATLTSFIWFSYHIVHQTVPIQKIKIKLALYSAFGTSLTLIKSRELEQFSVVLSCLLASYLWVQYLIELKSDE